MKIILNVDAITTPLTGIGIYANQLAGRLPQHSEVEEFKLYSSHRWIKDASHALKTNQKLAFVRKNIPLKGSALKLYTWQKNLWFKNKSKPFSDDFILHSPNYLLLPFDGPSVTTIHDLSFIRYPETHPKERVEILEKELPKTIAQASAIIVDSEYIKTEIQQILGVNKNKIHVVPLGVSKRYQLYPQNEVTHKLKKYKLDTLRYILSVATLEPRKNLNSLLDAYLLLPKKQRQENKLVIVGAKGWLSKNLSQRVQMLADRGDIITLGYIDYKDLPYIYAGAQGFALPSFYEGFGLPILEAMAAGTPVLTSTSSSLPEVADGAAILVNAYDIEDISAGLKKLIEDKQWQKQAIAKGLARAKRYTWEHCINNTVKVYQKIL
ncbi:MAG: glycosyltransferase family 4 protein [Proteobacteria bacterium]|nr:glycosyltransferase family 4 protein [Pseudomonadota bacterium]